MVQVQVQASMPVPASRCWDHSGWHLQRVQVVDAMVEKGWIAKSTYLLNVDPVMGTLNADGFTRSER